MNIRVLRWTPVLCVICACKLESSLPPKPDLVELELSTGALTPGFSPEVTSYTVDLPLRAEAVAVTATAAAPDDSTIAVNGVEVASGSASAPMPLAFGDNTITIVVTTTKGATRTYTITSNRGAGIVQRNYLKASNTGAGDVFGVAAFNGDTLVVGAPREDSNMSGNEQDDSEPDSGSVYVFVRSGSAWMQQARLKASNAGEGDNFGMSVALSTDGTTLAVGAAKEDSSAVGIGGIQADDSAFESGAVYVFVRTGTVWSQQAYVKASNTGIGDVFGTSVALSANGNTLAVGAIGEASASTGINGAQDDNTKYVSGAVYVFARAGTAWSQQAYVKASNTDGGASFGMAVALSTDGNTLAVGAHREDSSATGVNNLPDNAANSSGAVYVFVRSGVTWTQQAYVKASNTDPLDVFGNTLALSGDGNTLAIGAPFEQSAATGIDGDQTDNTAGRAGAVYVFTRSGTTWRQQAYIKASNTERDDEFSQVALSADGNTLAIGAPLEDSAARGTGGNQADNAAVDSGAVYVFTRSGREWSQRAYLKASNSDAGDGFGTFMALAPDGHTVVVGAPGEDSAATGVDNADVANNAALDSGAIYIFD